MVLQHIVEDQNDNVVAGDLLPVVLAEEQGPYDLLDIPSPVLVHVV